MSNRLKSFGLVAFYVAAIFLIGCIPEPENSLDWSDDGSVGLLRVEGALYLVDGKTDELTEIEKENVQPWPGISRDGSLIVYCQEVECNDLSTGLSQLPAGQVKMIEYNVKEMREDILKAGGLVEGKFPLPDGFLKNWAIRYLCENADDELLKIIKSEEIQKCRENDIGFYQIVVVPVDNLKSKRIVTTSTLKIMATQLSPDCKSVAYLMSRQIEKVEEPWYSLYVASLQADIKAMLIDNFVAFSYDWRKDSNAIAYISTDSKDLSHEESFGSLEERTVADANSVLVCDLSEIPDQGLIQTHSCTGQTKSLAGVFFFPWLKVKYGPGERIFFSAANYSIPTSTMEAEDWSLFCYDSLTGTVTDILFPDVKIYTSQTFYVMQFALSPDGKKVLLPITQNDFVIYELGQDSKKIQVKEQDSSGDGLPELFPSWKGNNEISCMASVESKFITEEAREKFKRDDEAVILEANGKFKRVLSNSWFDEPVP